ncbi:LysE family translocator [Nocardia sp. CDC159]|uniref:LysE family translocator n=1 Tax=Nocardia pulmonis TaxID=2951408 RepID=A0A9X2E0G0_9NOCA|nr:MULTISPECIES: LysE family translocator [Nocardia]MCM6771897.1 LysE family translocator [Nocardia pulmonis]MCM6785445.1 LysE family translocator [Nocardia sp. CDC159]
MTWSILSGFVLAVTLAAMVPGPTTALVIRRSALGGARAAVPIIGGMEIGIYGWVVASALGLSALVAASSAAFVVIRIVGAVVLVVLGVQAWRAARHPVAEAVDERAVGATMWRAVSTGLLTNLTNPKVAVFAFAFYPQFVTAGADILTTTLLLGLLHVVIDTVWFLVVATFVGRARAFFTRARVRQGLERVTGTVLIALGARLALGEV